MKDKDTPVEGLKKVQIKNPDKVVQIKATLCKEQGEALTLLIEFKEPFAWKPSDMPGINNNVITHEMNIGSSIRSIV